MTDVQEAYTEAAYFADLAREKLEQATQLALRKKQELSEIETKVKISKTDAAAYLGISRPTLNKYLDEGKIKSTRFDHLRDYKLNT